MKTKRILKLILFAPFLILLLIGAGVLHEQQSSSKSFESLDLSISINASLFKLDSERNASLAKIKNIISRYNQEMNLDLKQQIAEEIFEMSKKYPNLNIDFICATITHESAKTWDPGVTSKVGARGLMQIMPETGAFLAIEEGLEYKSAKILYDPIINIRLGCRYLSEMVGMYEKDGGLAAYNSGPRRAEMWLASNRNNRVLYAETRSYIPAVLKLYEEFRSEDQL